MMRRRKAVEPSYWPWVVGEKRGEGDLFSLKLKQMVASAHQDHVKRDGLDWRT